MLVYKFGGTSVGNPANMLRVIDLINDNQKKVVVVSAMSGTTNSLVEITNLHKGLEIDKAGKLLTDLQTKYIKTSEELISNPTRREKYSISLNSKFEALRNLLKSPANEQSKKIFVAQGEIITSELFQLTLDEKNINSVLLNALDFMKIDTDREPDYASIEKALIPILNKNNNCNLFITQGFICTNPAGEIDHFTRGGSDYTATILGAVVNANEIQIWTDIDGLHNNDPRFVENTKAVSFLSFEEAEELAYFGAKVLHPTCILPAKMKKIPVRLKNTMNPAAAGTFISTRTNGSGIKAIAAKDGITAIRIQSGRMLLAFGFLRKVFEIFEKYRTPVDMITTSEVSVSMTIDNTENLKNIVKELEILGNVEIIDNQTIISAVGSLPAEEKGIVLKVTEAFKEIPIRMISYGASNNNVTFLINTSYKRDVLNSLSKCLFQDS